MAHTEDGQLVVCAVFESRGGEVALAALSLATGTLRLHACIENSSSCLITMALLEALQPDVILACCGEKKVARGLAQLLSTHAGLSDKLLLAQRCEFNDTKGAVMVRSLARLRDKGAVERHSVLALAAAAALLRYLTDTREVVLLPNTLVVSEDLPRSFVHIDSSTVRNLELVAPLSGRAAAQGGSLLSLFKPKTKGGQNLLRATLLQPSSDLGTISARLDCLEELLSNEQLFLSLQAILGAVPKAAERVISLFVVQRKKVSGSEAAHVTASIAALLDLRSLLALVPSLGAALAPAACALLASMRDVCASDSLALLDGKISDLLEEDPVPGRAPFVRKTNVVFGVRTGVCGFLDVSRRAYCDTTEAIHALVTRYNDELAAAGSGLTFKAIFAPRRGFYLAAPAHEYEVAAPEAKAEFVQTQKKGRQVHVTSAELSALSVRLLDAANDSALLSQGVLDACFAMVREHLPSMTALSELLALLDVLVAFASTVSGSGRQWTRPLFSSADGPIAVQSGRHAVQETLPQHAEVPFVANHTFLSNTASLVMVTGPNMSGKTCYLKQVGLLCVLAHAGCFVPAEFASFRLLDRIFSVSMTQGDALEDNASTFMVECRELQHALMSATRNSLVLVDELGRATSTADAFALCFAACEHLLSVGPLTLCVTHLQRLMDLAEIYPGVKCSHLRVSTSSRRLDFQYQLTEGASAERHHYGCVLARTSGLPASLVDKAEEIVATLERQNACALVSVSEEIVTTLQVIYTLAQRLLSLNDGADALDEATLRDTLRRLRAAAIQCAHSECGEGT